MFDLETVVLKVQFSFNSQSKANVYFAQLTSKM